MLWEEGAGLRGEKGLECDPAGPINLGGQVEGEMLGVTRDVI